MDSNHSVNVMQNNSKVSLIYQPGAKESTSMKANVTTTHQQTNEEFLSLNTAKERTNTYYKDIFSKLPKNTQRAYLSDYNEFGLFCSQYGYQGFTNDFASNEQCIKHYVEVLCQSPLAYRTIKRRLSALSKYLGIASLPNPIIRSAYLRDFIRLSLVENKKYSISSHQAVPLTIEMLDSINNAVIPDSLLELRDLAIINIMFDALLRADEVVRVCLEHLSRRNNTLLVVSSKSDQAGQGQYRFVSESTLSMIQEFIDEANINPSTKQQRAVDDPRRISKGILFRRVSNHKNALLPFDESVSEYSANVLDYSSIYRIWKRIALRAGISENITPHSGRVGGAVSLAEDGATLPELQLAGGWNSPEMPGHYTKQANVKRGGMAKLSQRHKR